MQQPITNPPVPYIGPIGGGFTPGTMVRIQGQAPPTADRFNINFHCGPPPSNTALHISVRLLQNYIARNSLQGGDWGSEEDSGSLTIAPGQSFEILVLCDPASYKIAVNGNHFGEFRHRIPFEQVTHLGIDGDVSLSLIAFEGAGAAPAAPPMTGGPDYAYGPPPGQYGPPPQGPYGAGPYGPGPYGPPRPPGHKEESGFDNFLETAGTVIAGAFATGAAQNLLSGLTGSGGQQQQQHYQPPPPPPPPPQQPLFNLGGQGSVGGLGSVGSLLQTFAGQVLSGPKKQFTAKTAPVAHQPPPINMPMPSSVPLPRASMPIPSTVPLLPASMPMPSAGAPVYMPPLPTAPPTYIPPPPPSQIPPYGAPPSYFPPPSYSTSHSNPPIYPGAGVPFYPQQKMKKSKLKKAMKYGLPIAGAGLGAYALSHAIRHGHSSSSSSSSSDSD